MKPALKKTLIIGSVITVFGPLIGITGTLLGMIGVFGHMKQAGVADAEKFSGELGSVLGSTVVGLSVGLLGVCILIVAFFIWLSDRSQARQTAEPKPTSSAQ